MYPFLIISTLVLQLIAQKQETPDASETASSPTQDTASSLELTSAPAVLDDNANEQWCGYKCFWAFPSPNVLLSPPSLSKIHLLVIEYVSAILGRIAASFGTSTTFPELKSRDLLTTGSNDLDRRPDCTPNLADGTWECCFPDLVDGGLKCNAGSTLTRPKIFALPTLLFRALSSIPTALAAAIPEAVIPEKAAILEVDKRQDCTPNLVDGTWKCCFPDLVDGGLKCNAGSSLSPPRIFALPALLFKALSLIPGAIAAAIPEKASIPQVDKRQSHCTVNLVDGTWNCPPAGQCICDLITGDCWDCSAGSLLSPPRIFALPALVFKVLSSIPETLAAAVPHPLSISAEQEEKREDDIIGDVEARQTETNCWIDQMGMRQCFTFTPNVGSSSFSIPQIFSLPTLFINLIKQVSSVSALPQHFTESLAAPNFSLVRKTAHDAGEALSSWIEMDKRQPPICRPGQPPNLPCKNRGSTLGHLYLFPIPLLAFGVMVWL
jgi:hypothetical protein